MSTISVVVTTYNRAHLLPRAIKSIQGAGCDLEIIVVDDASSDATHEICATLSGIRYLRLSTNQGLAHARNFGIAASSSDFIAFLDDDDLRLPGSLDRQLQLLIDHPDTAFCYGQALIGDAERQLPTGEIYPSHCPTGDIFWDLLKNNFIPMPSVLARKSKLLEHGCFNDNLTLIEDWDMWLRLSEFCLVVAVEEPVAIHRKATAASEQMSSNSAAICRQSLRVQQLALSRVRAQSGTRAQRRRVRQELLNRAYEILMTEATNSIHEGDNISARMKVREAFRFRPIRTLVSGRLPWLLIAPR